MSDVEKKIVIKYSSEGIEKITQQVQSYNAATRQMITTTNTGPSMDNLTKVSQVTTNTTKGMNTLGSSLQSVMLRFIGLNAIIGFAVNKVKELKQWVLDGIDAFRSFQKEMAGINSILQEQDRNIIPTLGADITTLSIQYGKSVEDISTGLMAIVKAGFSVSDSMDILNTATKISIATNSDLATSVGTLTEILNAYGMSAANVETIANKLFQTMARGSLSFDSLQKSLGYVLPIASDAGISFDDLSAAISTATRQGQHIDSVTRGLGLMIQGLINPTKAAKDAMDKYGITVDETTLATDGLLGFFQQVNEATDTYGTQILPKIIGNMRSLRVAMALTSDEGISGMSTDMGLLETATGRADAALASMMNTQQQLADILAQSMQKIERSIGEAWSGVDIAFKKIQLWWGTLFSGGNANKAVTDFESQVEAIRQAYLQNIVAPATTSKETIYDKLFGKGVTGKTNLNTIINATSFSDLKTYIGLVDKITDANKRATAATIAQTASQSIMDTQIKTKTTLKNVPLGLNIDDKTIAILNTQLTALGLKTVDAKTSWWDFENIMSKVNETVSSSSTLLQVLTNNQNQLRPTVDNVTSAFDQASQQIDTYKTNIINLKNDIEDLHAELPKLNQQLKIMEFKAPFESFEENAKMGEKYGGEFITALSNSVDEYGNNLGAAVKTIYEYNQAMKDAEEETKKVTAANHELEIQMEKNNIQMLQLQLTGMMRRRGNTRAEQRQMKQIEIENTKIRIQEMQNQYTADVANNNAKKSADETAYTEAENVLQHYTDFSQHQLWILEDTRQQDHDDLAAKIKADNDLLDPNNPDSKVAKEKIQEDELLTLQTNYVTALKALSSDPGIAEAYSKILGLDITKEALAATQTTLTLPKTVTSNTGSFNWSGNGPAPRTFVNGRLTGFAEGTDYVPSTGYYQLHQGERVVPAGENRGSTVVINVNNPSVSSQADITRLANTLENVVRANLIDKQTGKSKYRMS